MDVARSTRASARRLLGTMWAVAAGYAVLCTLPAEHVSSTLRDAVIGNLALLFPVVAIAARGAASRSDRTWTLLLACGAASFLGGNLVYVFWIARVSDPPFPSVADAGYLGFYPFAIVALLLSMRSRLGRLRSGVALDGLIAVIASVMAGLWVITPLARAATGSTTALVTGLAYPVGDVLVMAAACGVLAATGGRPGGVYGSLIAGLALFAVADTVYAYRVAFETYEIGTPLDVLWVLGLAVVAQGVWRPGSRGSRNPGVSLSSLWMVLLGGAAALAVLSIGPVVGAPYTVQLAAVGTLVACVARIVTVFRQVAELAAVRRQAMTDELTSIANRRQLYYRMHADLDRDQQHVALLLLDLDRFKEVNDSLGHQAGDRLLQLVSDRLRDALEVSHPAALLARLGGDEFAVFAPIGGAPAAQILADRLQDALTEPISLGELTVHAKVSIGVALAPDHAGNRSDLLRCADLAMYEAKRTGRGTRVFDPDLLERTQDQLELGEQLHHGLHTGQLEVHYQPQVDGRRRVVSVEALVRWRHPTRGLVPPDVFLPLAEKRRLMPEVTRTVLRHAAADCARWRADHPDLTVSVNLSASDLVDPTLVATVRDCLTGFGLPAEALVLEITESNVMSDPELARSTLVELRQLGVDLAVDDYGTGHCSLAYLRRLPVQELKLDRSFVEHAAEDGKDAAIVVSTVELSRALGMRMVAEGVENEWVAGFVFDAGVDRAQGWHFARPMPASALEDWLHDNQPVPTSTSA